ncbi:methylated-DNA--[protein]-cysteine S-methyltransferase [Paenibacillus hamazuiensis]|uniref:methylated-DNA--[protein]-cysteine S-methyltransferase n=1 Tax=Paenibacillus hamazuiensis TaxID=2936508 RepID=UPI00200C2B21|nr:methylated-DNA--[protein]-cysteine S-methyltransferase [Paenibacillus hamazuiensis]
MKEKNMIYWSHFVHRDWKIYMAATEKGLAFVGSQNGPFEELAEWAEKCRPGCTLLCDEPRLEAYGRRLAEYFDGVQEVSALPVDVQGTPFQRDVWEALRSIPYGETRSYSDIAEQIGKSSAVRAVAAAIGANPVLIEIPCHRVVGKNGKLTGYRGGLDMKARLLQLEAQREAAFVPAGVGSR